MSGTLCKNGKRYATRGWTGAKHVKRETSKHERRQARAAIRDNDGEIKAARTKGWAW